jgi:hypothetical protein
MSQVVLCTGFFREDRSPASGRDSLTLMERKQDGEGPFYKKISNTFHGFDPRFIVIVRMSYKCPFISPFCLSSGKAEDTPSPALHIQEHAKALT